MVVPRTIVKFLSLHEGLFSACIAMMTVSTLIFSCSDGRSFDAGSVDRDNSSSNKDPPPVEDTIAEPTDIAGGFGLTCLGQPKADDATKLKSACRIVKTDGSKIQPSSTLDFRVSLSISKSEVRMEPEGEKYTFDFDVAIQDIPVMQINAVPYNPTTKTEKSSAQKQFNLKDVLQTL